MKQGEIVVVYRVENAQAMAAISNVQSHIKKTSDAASKSTSRITDTASKMGAGFASTAAVMKKFGLITVGAMSGGAVAMKGFVDSASDLQSLRASFVSLTGSAQSAEQVMRTLYDFGKKTAFTNEQIQTTAKSFLAMGVSVKNLPGLMQDLGDIAGATGADLGAMSLQISQAFGKGKLELSDWKILSTYIGGLKPILEGVVKQRTGISNLSDAFEKGAVSAEILREALDKANDRGNFAFEGAIKQSETFKGRMSNLQEQITNTGLKILGVDAVTGQIKSDGIFDRVSKSVTGLTDWLDKNEDTILRVVSAIQSNAVPVLGAFGAAFAAVKVGQFATSIVSSAIGLKSFITAVRGGQTAMAAFNAVASVNPFTIIAVTIAAVVGALTFLQIKFNIFGQAWDFIVSIWNGAPAWFGAMFEALGQIISGFANGVVGFFSGAWNAVVGVWNAAIGFFGSIWGGIVGVFSAAVGWFGGVFRGALNAVIGVFSGLPGWFRGLWSGIVGIFGSVGVSIGNAIGGAFKGAINGVLRFVSNMINGFIGTINGVIGIINAIPGVNIPRLGNVNIPQLAEGGIVTSATLAVIGEGSEPEAVIPLSKLTQFLKDMNEGDGDRRDGRGGAPQINQTVQLTNGIEVDEYNASLVRQMRRA